MSFRLSRGRNLKVFSRTMEDHKKLDMWLEIGKMKFSKERHPVLHFGKEKNHTRKYKMPCGTVSESLLK